MSYATIDDLRSQLGGPVSQPSAAYAAKMLHALPTATTVDREAFIVKHCAGKRVLEFGASGALHDRIKAAAAFLYASDKGGSDVDEAIDLDDVSLPYVTVSQSVAPDLIVCGELLEHLSNPGHFLARLRRQYTGVALILSVPNAFAAGQRAWLKKGLENVNRDHVAWYSPMTIATLLQRAGYLVGGLYYYNGDGPTAEGLVVVTE